jgi:hypothetical protein
MRSAISAFARGFRPFCDARHDATKSAADERRGEVRAKENRGRKAAAIGIRAVRWRAPSVRLRPWSGPGRLPRRRLVRLALRRLTWRLSGPRSRAGPRPRSGSRPGLSRPGAALAIAHAEVRVLRAAGLDQGRVDCGQRLRRPHPLPGAHHDRTDAVDHHAFAGAGAVLDEARLQAGLPDRGACGRWGPSRRLWPRPRRLLCEGRREPRDCGDDEGWQESKSRHEALPT